MARIFRDRYVVVALGVLAVFFSCVAVAFAYLHTTNEVLHGLNNEIWGRDERPVGSTNPSGSNVPDAWSTAEVRHYFGDGSYNVQCSTAGWGGAFCVGVWGSAPCQKRYVGGAEGVLGRHWVRRGPSCPGQIHA